MPRRRKRMGQRARRLLAEQKFGQGARHLAVEAAPGGGGGGGGGEGRAGGELHPSWEAKRQQALVIGAGGQGKKIKFGDDDGARAPRNSAAGGPADWGGGGGGGRGGGRYARAARRTLTPNSQR